MQVDDSSAFSTPLVVDRVVTASQPTAPTLNVRRHWWRVRALNAAGTVGPWSAVRRLTPRAFESAPALASLAVSPASVAGGASAQGTATPTSAAPAGGAVVSLASSAPATASVPAGVTVPAGATSATFAVGTAASAPRPPSRSPARAPARRGARR